MLEEVPFEPFPVRTPGTRKASYLEIPAPAVDDLQYTFAARAVTSGFCVAESSTLISSFLKYLLAPP